MKAFGICLQNLVAVRQQPSHRSEMTTQLLFGELVLVIDELDSWFLIVSAHDDYEGWVDFRQVTLLDEDEFTRVKGEDLACLTSCHGRVVAEGLPAVNVLIGSKFPGLNDKQFVVADRTFVVAGETVCPSSQLNIKNVIQDAMKFMGSPYLWGGRSLFGIDCSGLVQVVFGMNGISLPRDSAMQARIGQSIDFVSEAETGDLAFFENQDEEIVHVGIMLDNKTVIHASGEVRIDGIDHHGIFHAQHKKYSHKLRIIKRLT